MTDEDDLMDKLFPIDVIEQRVLDLPIERSVVAFARALKELSVPYSWQPNGSITVQWDGGDLDDFLATREFMDAYGIELKLMVVNDMRSEFEKQGILKPAGIDKDGSVIHIWSDDV